MESSNGIDRTIEGHISEMVKRGYEVTLLATEAPKHKEVDQLALLGVEVIQMPCSQIFIFWKCWKMRRDFELLSLHSVFTPLNWIVSMCLKCPRILTPNGGYSPAQIRYRSFFRKQVVFFLYERRMLERALFVHVLSQNEAKQLALVAPSARSVIAPNGFDSSKAFNRSYQCEGDEIRLLYIGRVALMHKGLDLLIEALSEVSPAIDWQLDVIGPFETGAREVLEGILERSPSASKRVSFHGPLYGDGKSEFINRADLFVHTSRYEGMPFSVIEAMSSGLPVLITPGTNMVDLVEKSEVGWVISERVLPEELEKVLVTTCEELEKRGRSAQRLVVDELNWSKIGDSIFGEVERLLKKTTEGKGS